MTNKYNIEELFAGIKSNDRTLLARAITLIESNLNTHQELAQQLLAKILPFSGNSFRIGITGAPGAGKSTFIDTLGYSLCEQGHKVAVLAIDPSSIRSKGSILGDKTRMEKLASHPNAFIRPSPSGGVLGGVARKTRETILICESAGYDVILVETIGVGQSEITVRSLVDCFLLLILPGGGDELQGIKKGAVEIADIIAINKAEPNNMHIVNATLLAYQTAVHYLLPATDGWETKVVKCSALNGTGITEIWNIILDFFENIKQSGVFSSRRNEQLLEWFNSMLDEGIKNIIFSNNIISREIQNFQEKILSGQATPTFAVIEILKLLKEHILK